jgi:ABC-type multidrug transport system ATPase subunit
LGPFSRTEIEQKLARQEIGLLHEIYSEGRWFRLREFRFESSSAPGDRHPEASSVLPPIAEPRSPQNQSAAGPGEEQHYLRWKGLVLGPLGVGEIERKLDRQEIGILHEISLDGHWATLNDFFVYRNAIAAKARVNLRQPFTTASSSAGKPAGGRPGARMVIEKVSLHLKNGTRILDDISLVVEPNEFVALLGPSGSGKSTLMNAITGRRRASSGQINLSGEEFYANSAKYCQRIGHVPQQDIVHFALSVQQELSFSAKLRLPSAAPEESVRQRIADVISQIGLCDETHTRISDLSGGQLKRVSLGVELLSDPELLFLDEATSGLDAGTEARMMSLFRRLADSGRTVVCITHNLENVSLCDLVLLLAGGRLAYFGPPSGLLTHFGLERLSQVYDCLETKSPEEWVKLYRACEDYQKYVLDRQRPSSPGSTVDGLFAESRDPAGTRAPNGCFHQFLVLTQRYFTITLQDPKNVILLLAQAPIIALLLGLVFRNEDFNDPHSGVLSQKMLGFLLVVSGIWFGCINAAREIVKELPIYLRERAISLHLGSYVGSKIAVLTLLGTVQCGALLAITLAMVGLKAHLGLQSVALLLACFSGMLMGLLVSALARSEDKAMAIVPILLIPQVIFSGAMLQVSGLAEEVAKWTVVSYWAFDAMIHALPSHESLLKPHYDFAGDVVAISSFMLMLGALAILALKRKDLVK